MRRLALLMILGIAMVTIAVRLSVPEGAAEFDPPARDTPLSLDDISIKLPAWRAPADSIGNVRWTTIIAFEP